MPFGRTDGLADGVLRASFAATARAACAVAVPAGERRVRAGAGLAWRRGRTCRGQRRRNAGWRRHLPGVGVAYCGRAALGAHIVAVTAFGSSKPAGCKRRRACCAVDWWRAGATTRRTTGASEPSDSARAASPARATSSACGGARLSAAARLPAGNSGLSATSNDEAQ
jgi:hypothetical protein